MDQRLSIVTLGVSDLAVARAFYKRLGWQEAEASNDNIAFFQMNGCVFSLYPLPALMEDANLPEGAEPAVGATAVAMNFGSKEEVDRAMAEAEKAGATILKSAQPAFWGGYSGYFADPDGHPWELAWNPYATLDEKGNMQI